MKIIHIDTPELHQACDEFVLKSEVGSVWQHSDWGKFQNSLGNNVFRLAVFDTEKRTDPTLPGDILAVAQVIESNLPMKKKWWYIPRGPIWTEDRGCGALLQELQLHAKNKKAIFIKLDPEQVLPVTIPTTPTKTVQPEHTLLLDLTKSEDDILAQMKPKGRYNIRLAEKKDIKIRITKSTENFYKLLEHTTQRDGFRGWGRGYYDQMLKNLNKNITLLEAVHENEVIASGIFTFYGDKAVYYYGASGNHKRNLMAPYLVQWHAIQEAKKRGCKSYDFLGIAPENEKNHPWVGVTDFKLKFGGQRKKYPQPGQITISPLWTKNYKIAQSLRKIFGA